MPRGLCQADSAADKQKLEGRKSYRSAFACYKTGMLCISPSKGLGRLGWSLALAPKAVGSCFGVAVNLRSYSAMRLCGYAAMRLCGYAAMRPRGCAAVRLRSGGAVGRWGCLAVGLCDYAAVAVRLFTA